MAKKARKMARSRLSGEQLLARCRKLVEEELRPFAIANPSERPAPDVQDKPGHMRRVGALAVGLTRDRRRVERLWFASSGKSAPAVATMRRFARAAWPETPWACVVRLDLGPREVMLRCRRRRMA